MQTVAPNLREPREGGAACAANGARSREAFLARGLHCPTAVNAKRRKLSLRKQSLRRLDDAALDAARGGSYAAEPPSDVCQSNLCTTARCSIFWYLQ